MVSRSRTIVILLIVAAGCRRDVLRLDDVQKMAYEVKPAVVRVSAFATAQCRYDASTIRALEAAMQRDVGADVIAQKLDSEELSVDTGAGGSGSGFIIHPDGWILTSGHVVAPTRDPAALQRDLLRNGAIAALLKHFPVEQLRRLRRGDALEQYISALTAHAQVGEIVIVNEVELSNGEKLPFKLERFSPALYERGTDLALLRVIHKNLPVLDLGDSDNTRVGDSIWSIGYPAVASSTDDVIGGWLSRDSDLEATVNPGIITAIKRDVANTPVLQSNVAIYRGNSGGPAVNKEGEVVGISTWGHTDAEQIKFLVPVNIAKSFIAAARVAPNNGGEFNRHYRAALDAAADAQWGAADRELAAASQLFQNSPDLVRFRRDTARALQSMPLWRRHPLALSAIGIALLAVLTALLFPLFAKRRIPKELDVATTVETIVAPVGRERGEHESIVAAATAMLGRFTILNGSRAGERLGLGGSGIRIGRERAICEIVLENPKVSRLHAEVVSIDGKVLLIDRNSSNGTYVNDQKIDKRFLQDGDIIYFGGRNAVAVAFHA
jgi:S1-C subfamily serine protease